MTTNGFCKLNTFQPKHDISVLMNTIFEIDPSKKMNVAVGLIGFDSTHNWKSGSFLFFFCRRFVKFSKGSPRLLKCANSFLRVWETYFLTFFFSPSFLYACCKTSDFYCARCFQVPRESEHTVNVKRTKEFIARTETHSPSFVSRPYCRAFSTVFLDWIPICFSLRNHDSDVFYILRSIPANHPSNQ